jgi:proteic killer suppression protein
MRSDLDILFGSHKLEKVFNSQKLLVKEYGDRQAALIRRRLDELQAANALAELRSLPQLRCHELIGNRAGQLSVDLVHPYRLLFEVADEPVPRKADGGLDWTQVTAVMVIGVEDTHE